ncbi:MAG TPA: (2Fe-2S) ferredoxin domain-containing protein [Terricaulis sp.]|nr:(2Fe-2S) ferredoxin domain-containing protein [Terricaulis sp.]
MKSARSQWGEVVLICRKCSKKLGGGFGSDGDKSLAKVLRKRLRLAKGRRARVGVVEVDCLKLCPKDAVTVVLGREPGVMRVVRRKTPAKAVVAALGLEDYEQGKGSSAAEGEDAKAPHRGGI